MYPDPHSGSGCRTQMNIVNANLDPRPCLKLIVVLPVEHHRLEPMTPEDLARQVGGPGLEIHARRLNAALHDDCDLKLLLG